MTISGILKGLQLAAVHGITPAILGLIFGLSAMFASFGVWLFRPWAFQTMIIWSISTLIWLFNWQYGLNGKYTLPNHYFIMYFVFGVALLSALTYYVKRKLKKIAEG